MSTTLQRESRASSSARMGAVLREHFEASGLTYAEVARRTGIPASTVRDHIQGKPGRYLITDICAFADVFGVKVGVLLDAVDTR